MKSLRIWGIVLVGVLVLGVLIFGKMLVQKVDQSEIIVIVDPIDGDIHVHASAGTYLQRFGTVTSYLKRGMTESVQKVRFLDGGHADLEWTMQWDMPEDPDNLSKIRSKYPSDDAVRSGMIEAVVNKVIYNTGPLMSSKESYSDKRNDLTQYIIDQVENGMYQTKSREVKTIDPLSGQEKTVQKAEILLDKDGGILRSELPILASYNVRPFNFQIKRLGYSPIVEKQIEVQQEINMKVQTAMASAKEAEQQTITVTEQGKAAAAKAKWEKEAVKAAAVTEAEKLRDVAQLAAEQAGFYKKEQILRAEGDAEYKRKVMAADGALTLKLATYETVMNRWADAFEKHQQPLVPQVVMGGSDGGIPMNAAQQWLQIMGVKAAKDLGLDMGMRTNKQP